MAIGIVSDDELERELANSGPAPVGVVVTLKRGRGEDKTNTPPAVRKIIGEESVTHGHAAGVELGKALGVSESSVSAYQKGSTSTALMDRPDPELLEHITEVQRKVAKSARHKLALAIDAITEDKLAESSPRIAAGVAKDMSVVVKNMEPSTEGERGNSTKFVFFVPNMRKEDQFEVIDVKE